jgi:hypothetical protein
MVGMTHAQEGWSVLAGNAVVAVAVIAFQDHLNVFSGLLWGVCMCWSIVCWEARWRYSVGMKRWYRRW